MMLLCVVAAVLMYLSAGVVCSPFHFVVLPNVLRLETEEVVSLTCLEAEHDVTYKIYLQDHPDRRKVFFQTVATVPQGEVRTVKVVVNVADLPQPLTSPLFVQLVVETVDHEPPFKKEATLLVNESPGYIFIQTDKPLYTPDQSVYTRVMTLNENFRPVQWPFQVDIQNPDGMTISRKLVDNTKDLITKDVMKIPDNPVYGNWTVTAKFVNGLKTSSSVRFEVKEYVLPTFSVSFHIPDEAKVILANDTNIRLVVGAKYTYGKPVIGHVTVIFGLLWHGHVFHVGKQRNLQLNATGFTECGITMDELRLPVQAVWFPNGGKLHLQAAVTELASGRIEKADDVSIVFSDHLYVIKFTRSSRQFKPGLPYVLEIDVYKANGDLGSNLPIAVTCKATTSKDNTEETILPLHPGGGAPLLTDARGRLTVTYFIPAHVQLVQFKVWPRDVSIDQLTSSTFAFGVSPFYSPSAVYMHLQATLTDVKRQGQMPRAGDYITVLTTYTSAPDIATVNLLIVSRGKIVWQASTRNIMGNSTTFHLQLTNEMAPGARILAFAIKGEEAGAEVVSDSVWMDIMGQCDGELSIKREDDSKKTLRPGDIGTVTLTGVPNMVVGLLAVDSAVYHLKNSSLTRRSVFQQLSAHDRGCGYSGGRDTAKVFEYSGLTVLTNAGVTMTPKTVEGCADKMVRKRRSPEAKKRALDLCCLEGASLYNASLSLCYYASQQLKKRMTFDLCAQEFFRCCKDIAKGRISLDSLGRMMGIPKRAGDELEVALDEDVMQIKNIPIRTNFPESWWFEEYNLGPEGRADVDFVLPDSITTWSVEALGMSMETGLCLAPPLELVTFSSFFVHLDLPYSVIRLEQLEVRATVYNYMNRKLRVNLLMHSVDGICYSSPPGEHTDFIRLEIEPNEAASAYFPIVPLEIGEFPITVKAFSSWGRDAVERILRVEGEGIEKIHTISVMLDPSGKRFLRHRPSNQTFNVKNEVRVAEKRQSVELDLDLPQEVIPDTDSCTLHAMGDLLGPTLQVMIDGVTELLRMPTGCGEQNLIYLAPNVFVTRYLRSTRRLSALIEKKAIALIRQGVSKQAYFRKSDASYGTWPHADSSTWLTAFAMKTLCQAEHYVTVDHTQTCESFNWIARQQHDNGTFREEVWVTHREMLGGINGDVSHAAFILIALLECDCPKENHSDVITRTQKYIESASTQTDRPLAIAISAYALTLAGSPVGDQLMKRLLSVAKSSPEGFTYWSPGTEADFANHDVPYWYAKKPGALAVEVTSYALLTFLARGDITTSTSVVGWLLMQRNSQGAFVSTQDTVVALQALSEYSMKSYSAILDMTCHIRSEVDDRFRKSISLTPSDAMVVKSVPKVPTGGKLHFEAEGTGVGMMQVEVRFNVPEDQSNCRFEVKVTTHHHNTLLQSFFGESRRPRCEPCSMDCEDESNDDEDEEEDFENFTFPPIMPRIATLWGRKARGEDLDLDKELQENHAREKIPEIEFGSRIGRPRRSTRPYSATVICVETCFRYLGTQTTGMAVVDVGLFTGYVPVIDDLETLKKKGKIDNYEKSQRSVVLYLNEISNKDTTCVKFRARQEHVADNIQPAKVQVFDYYNPDERCTVFYKANNVSGQLANFCDNRKQICQCLESRCALCEESWHGLGWMDVMKFACTNATYVLEVKALDRDLEKAGFERLLGQINAIHSQRGRHEMKVGDKVILLKRSSCFCPRVTPGENYLMLLSDSKRFKDADGHQIYAFLLDKKVFVIQHLKPRGLSGSQKEIAKVVKRVLKRLERRGCGPHKSVRSGVRRRRVRRVKHVKMT
ncbi:complement C3-like [Physella acuta]|uniref:complement C3-like n=1 Tax=Physella acuta TaxID=109671 RepID=UPI0027DD7628|nr:complement C3-like [Physella acuta]